MQFDWIDVASKLGFPAAVTAFLLVMLPRALGKIHARIDATAIGVNLRLERIAFFMGKLAGPDAVREADVWAPATNGTGTGKTDTTKARG